MNYKIIASDLDGKVDILVCNFKKKSQLSALKDLAGGLPALERQVCET